MMTRKPGSGRESPSWMQMAGEPGSPQRGLGKHASPTPKRARDLGPLQGSWMSLGQQAGNCRQVLASLEQHCRGHKRLCVTVIPDPKITV